MVYFNIRVVKEELSQEILAGELGLSSGNQYIEMGESKAGLPVSDTVTTDVVEEEGSKLV